MLKQWILLMSLCWITVSQAAVEMIFLDKTGIQESSLRPQVALLNRFYGIEQTDLPGTQDSAAFLLEHLQNTKNKTLAVVINAEILHDLDQQNTLKVLHKLAPNVPVLIAGVTANTNLTALKAWAGESISAIKNEHDFVGQYFIQKHLLTQQLAEQQVAWQHPEVSWLQLAQQAKSEIIIQLENHSIQPIFIKTEHQGLPIFVASYIQPEDFFDEQRIWRLDTRRFLQIAPLMLVLQSACGEYCWHSPKHFANLTIDDPWLTEAYGPLRFQELLKEMQQAKFHTTIGLIPWNYDRSEAKVIEIFKNNPDYYSLAMHGNNHDHREFYKYSTTDADPWPAKPLEVQDFNLQQGLARLEKFHELTGLNYDRVMIFPHEIAPEQTLALLKTYNFLATVNGGNIPLDSPEPTDPLFYFRNVSTQFANFPSVNRLEPSEYAPAQIALDLYLGNSVLFFEHSLYFSKGLDVFNTTASYVNGLQPDIQWANLGEIAQHLYVQRKINEHEYEVQAFGRLLKLYNPSSESVAFTVFKGAVAGEKLASLTRNDQLQSFNYKPGSDYFTMQLTIPPQETQVVEIKYSNQLDLSKIALAKEDVRVNRLRRFADFRDITVSGTWLGRTFIKWYYGSDTYQVGLGKLLIFLAFSIFVFVLLLWFVIRYVRRAKTV